VLNAYVGRSNPQKTRDFTNIGSPPDQQRVRRTKSTGHFITRRHRLSDMATGQNRIGGRSVKALLATGAVLCALFSMESLSGVQKKKPAISEENVAELQTARIVFIDGNSESADKLRDKLETYTCLRLTNNKSKADAILSVDEQARRSALDENGSGKISASVIVTMPNGDQVWNVNKLGQGGFVHTGAGTAATNVLRALAKDACPGWSLRNEGAEGSHFHKEYVRPGPLQ
jgi:hypothetical protein